MLNLTVDNDRKQNIKLTSAIFLKSFLFLVDGCQHLLVFRTVSSLADKCARVHHEAQQGCFHFGGHYLLTKPTD